MAEAHTMNSAMRQFYRERMERLLNITIRKLADGRFLKVGFSKYGNKHLYSDAASRRSGHFMRSDLLNIDSILENSSYVESASISKPRNDDIIGFHYFKTNLHGSTVYLNIAEQKYGTNRPDTPGDVQQVRTRNFVYSMTDRLKTKRKARS